MLTVAIVGRPNVGKSTLFNRLVGKKLALVDDTPGVTRDRREGDARLGPLRFRIFDTAGLEDRNDSSLEARMRRQTEIAITQSDLCLFLIDARAGVTPLDKHFADLLRKSPTPVCLVANKCEGRAGAQGLAESWALGLGDPVALSAEHGEGLEDLYDVLAPYAEAKTPEGLGDDDEMPEAPEDAEPELDPERALRLAIVGRPNAGKSTLINRLLGEDRMLTGPEPGITRDSIAVEWRWQGQRVRLHDTAGMRRKARVTQKLEKLSVADSLRAIRFAEAVVLLLDAATPFEKQDLAIADLVEREGRALVVAVNKWDTVEDQAAWRKELTLRLEELLPQVKGVPIVFFSALTGRGLDKLMPAVVKVLKAWNRRVSTARLNRWLGAATERHAPPAVQGRAIRLRYMTQVKARPPSFVIFSSRADDVPESYLRYLTNGLRADFELQATPIRITVRKPKNPYEDRD